MRDAARRRAVLNPGVASARLCCPVLMWPTLMWPTLMWPTLMCPALMCPALLCSASCVPPHATRSRCSA
ncbi:protein of unknown function [Pararobbsia alpina]